MAMVRTVRTRKEGLYQSGLSVRAIDLGDDNSLFSLANGMEVSALLMSSL